MTIGDLAAFGANTNEGLQRCMGNEGFYLRLVKMIPGDSNFQKLYDALDGGNWAGAFEAAHALKGALGNLSLTPIYEPIFEITEKLRACTTVDCTDLVVIIRQRQEELKRLCES